MADTTKPAYMVVALEVKDHQDYLNRYAAKVLEQFEKIGAEVLAASAAATVVEGEWRGNWTVIVKFPSMAVATQWYNAAYYQPLKQLRINELTCGGTAIFVEAFDMSVFS
ncbi:MAG: DUF1330 domain-containing protein [Porticoccaceae bacterium]|nr:DUF1330 domain-containing protein [Porticoccaceae bacterium]